MRQIEVIVDAVNQQIESLKSEVDELMKVSELCMVIYYGYNNHRDSFLHI